VIARPEFRHINTGEIVISLAAVVAVPVSGPTISGRLYQSGYLYQLSQVWRM
jgi:hypothetical protein